MNTATPTSCDCAHRKQDAKIITINGVQRTIFGTQKHSNISYLHDCGLGKRDGVTNLFTKRRKYFTRESEHAAYRVSPYLYPTCEELLKRNACPLSNGSAAETRARLKAFRKLWHRIVPV